MGTSKTRLTIKEAALVVGMSASWLYQRIQNGEGPPHKIRGNKILIDRKELERWDSAEVIR